MDVLALKPTSILTALATLGFALGLGLPSASATNLIQSGSFESPDLPGSSGFTSYSTPNFPFAGWSLTDGAVDVFLNRASDGIQSVDLNKGANNGATLEQSFATSIGQSYDVSFDIGGGTGHPTNPTPLKTLQVRIESGGSSIFSQDVEHDAGQTTDFSTYGFSFTANGSSSTLVFQSTYTSNYNGPHLDNVVVSAVPEPTGVLLVSAMLGLVTLRRSSRP